MEAPGVADAAVLRHEVDRAFDAGSMVVLDLTETTFIDLAMVGVVAYAAERAGGESEHDFIVVAPPGGQPRRVLDLVGGDRFATVVDDLETGLGSV